MSETSIIGDPVIVGATTALTAVVKPRPGTDLKAQDLHRARIVVAGFGILAVIISMLAMVTTYPKPPPTPNAMLGGKSNAGKIISYIGPDKKCREQTFDNATGQMTKSSPCDLSALDKNAASASSNSGGRLDEIRKAFSGRRFGKPLSLSATAAKPAAYQLA
jgi:hypothetical protein